MNTHQTRITTIARHWRKHPVSFAQIVTGLMLLTCSAAIGLRETTEFSASIQGWLFGPGAAGVVVGLGSTVLGPREDSSSTHFWALTILAITGYILCITLGVILGWNWILAERVYDLTWAVPALLYLSNFAVVYFPEKASKDP